MSNRRDLAFKELKARSQGLVTVTSQKTRRRSTPWSSQVNEDHIKPKPGVIFCGENEEFISKKGKLGLFFRPETKQSGLHPSDSLTGSFFPYFCTSWCLSV